MGVQERRAREKDELRRKILNAASELFVNEGFESVSMRRIAEKVEYSPASIYLYFKDKSEIVQSICQETFAELHERLDAMVELDLPPLEEFHRGCETYVRFGLEHPSHYIVTMCTPEEPASQNIEGVDCEAIYAEGMRAFGHLRRCIAKCMNAGLFREADAETVAQAVWLSIHGLTAGLITCAGFPFVDRDELIKTHLDMLTRGLRA